MNISIEFYTALNTSSTYCTAVCEGCDRCHFVHPDFEDNYEDDDRVKDLLDNHKKDPDKYIEHHARIDYCNVMDKQYVIECTCGELKKFQDLFWQERHLIGGYFNEMLPKVEALYDREKETLSTKVPE